MCKDSLITNYNLDRNLTSSLAAGENLIYQKMGVNCLMSPIFDANATGKHTTIKTTREKLKFFSNRNF